MGKALVALKQYFKGTTDNCVLSAPLHLLLWLLEMSHFPAMSFFSAFSAYVHRSYEKKFALSYSRIFYIFLNPQLTGLSTEHVKHVYWMRTSGLIYTVG